MKLAFQLFIQLNDPNYQVIIACWKTTLQRADSLFTQIHDNLQKIEPPNSNNEDIKSYDQNRDIQSVDIISEKNMT